MHSPIFLPVNIHNLIIKILNTNLIISHAIISFEMMHLLIVDHTNGTPVSHD